MSWSPEWSWPACSCSSPADGREPAAGPAAPTPEKLTTYECGVDPVGEGWAQTQIRYYLYAFLYVIFAVDAVYLFPWATVLRRARLRRGDAGRDGDLPRRPAVGLLHAGAAACCGGS